MFNPFKLKRMIALLIVGAFPIITYMFLEPYTSDPFNWSPFAVIGGTLLSVIVFSIVAGQLLRHPFTKIVEGEGLAVFDVSSTGIVQPFLIRVAKNEVVGKLGKSNIKGVFDRESVYQLAEPVNVSAPLKIDEETGDVTITITNAEYHRSRFALYHRPLLLYNSQIQSLLTKDYLSDKEKNTFTEYGLLYLVRKVEELSTAMLNFGRYVVEMTRPKQEFVGSTWFWILIIGGIGVLAVMFGPSILEAIQGASSSATQSVGGVINPVK
jgi:hypothetical protein